MTVDNKRERAKAENDREVTEVHWGFIEKGGLNILESPLDLIREYIRNLPISKQERSAYFEEVVRRRKQVGESQEVLDLTKEEEEG